MATASRTQGILRTTDFEFGRLDTTPIDFQLPSFSSDHLHQSACIDSNEVSRWENATTLISGVREGGENSAVFPVTKHHVFTLDYQLPNRADRNRRPVVVDDRKRESRKDVANGNAQVVFVEIAFPKLLGRNQCVPWVSVDE